MCLKCKLINYKSLHLDWGAYFYEDFITSTNTDVGKPMLQSIYTML